MQSVVSCAERHVRGLDGRAHALEHVDPRPPQLDLATPDTAEIGEIVDKTFELRDLAQHDVSRAHHSGVGNRRMLEICERHAQCAERITDLMGKDRDLASPDGVVAFEASEAPTFLLNIRTLEVISVTPAK